MRQVLSRYQRDTIIRLWGYTEGDPRCLVYECAPPRGRPIRSAPAAALLLTLRCCARAPAAPAAHCSRAARR